MGHGMASKLTEGLVQITAKDYGVIIDLKYGTNDNFTGKQIYQKEEEGCFLHPEAAAKLKKAAELAKEKGFQLKIFDAFRPVDAHRELQKSVSDPKWVSKNISNHSRGVALDLTLATPEGKDLDMGTAFDAFTDLSEHGASVSKEVTKNRKLLRSIMEQAGFTAYEGEWWHYQLPNAREPGKYPYYTDKEAGTGLMSAPATPAKPPENKQTPAK